MILSFVDVEVVLVMLVMEQIYCVEFEGCKVMSISELLIILYFVVGRGLFFLFRIVYLILVLGKVEYL